MLDRSKLGKAAQAKLDNLKRQHPDWHLKADQSDEFPIWMDSGEDDEFLATPRRPDELIEWLRKNPEIDDWKKDDWRQRCQDDFQTVASALYALAEDDIWFPHRWREALQAWSNDSSALKCSWPNTAVVLAGAPDNFVYEVAQNLSCWLKEQAQTFEGQEDRFFLLIRRILEMEHRDMGQGLSLSSQAYNHPVGQVTEALMRWWYRRSPRDGQGLPEEIESLFSELCNQNLEKFRHGRLILATHAISLFRVDECWSTNHLLPLFDWQLSEPEARVAWTGFMSSPRFHPPLMEAIKRPLLETAKHAERLGEHGVQYIAFLTFAALEQDETFSKNELAGATRALSKEGLLYAAEALVRALEGAGSQRKEYWKNRVSPYFNSTWPKSRDTILPEISRNFALLCVAAGEAFPEALEKLKHWLRPFNGTDRIIRRLDKSDLSRCFPDDALKFLDRLIGDDTFLYASNPLSSCLKAIRESKPCIQTDPRFQKLEYKLRRN